MNAKIVASLIVIGLVSMLVIGVIAATQISVPAEWDWVTPTPAPTATPSPTPVPVYSFTVSPSTTWNLGTFASWDTSNHTQSKVFTVTNNGNQPITVTWSESFENAAPSSAPVAQAIPVGESRSFTVSLTVTGPYVSGALQFSLVP